MARTAPFLLGLVLAVASLGLVESKLDPLNITQLEQIMEMPSLDSALETVLTRGSINGGFYTHDEALILFNNLAAKYANLVQIEPVGSSFLGKPIYCVRVSGIPRSKEASYPALLAAGMMHAREMVSLSTHIYTIFRILYHARHQDPDVLDLLRRTNLYFVPMVNVDGVREISERHNRSLPLIRKNRHKNRVNCPKTEDIGVDLNRNFAYDYAGTGSSGNECDEEYRGTQAFSEPESLTIKKFVDSHQNIKFFLDLHAYGNLYILPSSLVPGKIKGTPYEEFFAEAGLSPKHKFGTSMGLLSYRPSGDISDWMYIDKGIMSLSVEIGTEESFFPRVLPAIQDIELHFSPFLYAWNKIVQQIEIEVVKTHKRFCDKTVAAGILECSVAEDSEIIYLILNITNKGFSPSDNDAATVYLIAPGDKVQVTRIFKDLQELNVTHAVSLISNGYSISLPGMKPRESNELMVVLNKARDVANKSYIINLKYNEYPHLTQRAQKNIDIDTATVSLDSVFSVETYAGRKGLRYYIWMALATVAFIAILALGVFYVARIWKRRENVPVDLPLPEIIREEVPSIEVAESKDNL